MVDVAAAGVGNGTVLQYRARRWSTYDRQRKVKTMSGNKNPLYFLDLGFAHNSTTRLKALGSGEAARRGRPATAATVQNAESAAAKFIVLCEQEHDISRRAFRQMIVEALSGQQQDAQITYFMEHAAVFNDWLYGVRTMPTWAKQIVAELMFGMLADKTTKAALKSVVERYLPEVIQEVAGGAAMLQWLVGAHSRAVSKGVMPKE